jgi:DNA polymerase-1
MMNAFLSGKDMHTATAERLRKHLGLDETEPITDEKRKKAKTLNFSVLFGSGDRNVASQLQCSVKEARALIAEYYKQFPTVTAWKEQMHQAAIDKGYCETRFGRRRYISELDYYSPELYAYTKTGAGLPRTADQWTKDKFYKLLHGLRIAVNTPIQGTAADIFKVALRRLDKEILQKMPVKLHAVVHDSFILSVDESVDPSHIESVLKSITEIKIPDYVPIVMDVKFGYNWKNMVKLDKFVEQKGKGNVGTKC